MSFMSPTKLKTTEVLDWREILGGATATQSVTLPVEPGRDLTVVIVNNNATTDYAGAKVAFYSRLLSNVPDNWISAAVAGFLGSELTGNDIALKKGETRLKIAQGRLTSAREVKIIFTGTASSPLYAYAAWGLPDVPYFKGDGFQIDVARTDCIRAAAYENHTAYLDSANVLEVSDGITRARVALSTLPGWIADDSVGAIGFIPYKQGGPDASGYSRETSMRLCFFTAKGNVYHNRPAANAADTVVNASLAAFDLSAVYEPVYRTSDDTFVSSARIPSNNSNLTAEEQKLYRYEPGLPAWNYAQHSANIPSPYGSGGHPAVLERSGMKLIRIVHPFAYGTNPQDAAYPYQMHGYLGNAFSVKPKCTTYVPYNGINATKNVILGTTDGGRTWVVLHEIGLGAFIGTWGNNFDYSALGAYTPGELSTVKRTYNYPSAAAKDPANAFLYSAPVAVTNIATVGGKAIVTAPGHGLYQGALVCFKKNAPGAYSFLENTITDGNAGAFNSNSAGNGRFYRVKLIDGDSFELLQNYGGVDEKIDAHHLHSGNAAKDGVVVACGERYTNGWILFISIPKIDDFEYFDPYTYRVANRHIYRLTSTDTAVQRAVGFVLNDDADQTFLFASDDSSIPRGPVAITGRTAGLPVRNSAGVFAGKLADIDDITKAAVVCEMEEASLGLVKTQGMHVVIGMSRNIYLSRDGRRWVKIPMMASVGGYSGEGVGAIYLRVSSTLYRVSMI